MSNVLFEDGDWRLVKDNYYGIVIYHHCPDDYAGKAWWCVGNTTRCSYCRIDIPDEMLGFRKLANWDR